LRFKLPLTPRARAKLRERTSRCYDKYNAALRRLRKDNHKLWQRGKPLMQVLPYFLELKGAK
jgi:hypothetical protein